MSLKSAFSREVFRARSEQGLTQQQVAEAVSISVRWYQYIENSSVMPGAVVMLRLLLFLKIDVELFREEAGLVAPVLPG